MVTCYKTALPVFEQMMIICSIQVQFEEIMDTRRSLHHTHIAEKGINSGYGIARGTLLIGETM